MANSAVLLVIAVALVLLGSVFAAADAAISTVSQARVEGLVRTRRPGARQLSLVIAERRRHINLLLLLRLGCELTATVLVTVVFLRWISPDWLAVVVAAVVMGLASYVLIGESVDAIVGVANLKDLVRTALNDDSARLVGELMNPAGFVPDSKRLDDLLKEMQVSRNHMAIAVDEYGGTAGLLTIEDILEE